MDSEFISILRCPLTHKQLLPGPEETIQTADGSIQYKYNDGIYDFLCDINNNKSKLDDKKIMVENFYEKYGWETTDDGCYKDSASFAALGETAKNIRGNATWLLETTSKKVGAFY